MNMKLTALGAGCVLAFSLAGCSEDEAPAKMAGTAAVGAALANATVAAVGANGQTTQTTTDANGNYNLNVSGLTAPIFVKVSGGTYDHDGDAGTADIPYTGALFSLSASLAGRINTTPLTTLVLQNAFSASDLNAIFTGWDLESDDFSLFAFTDGINRIAANFATQLTAAGLTPTTYNFFTTQFSADGTGIDGVLDDLSCTATGDTPVVVSCTYDGTPISFDYTGTSISGYTMGQNLTIKVKSGPISRTLPAQVVPPPPSEELFCTGSTYINQFANAAEGSVTISSCSFSGNVGTMKGTVTAEGFGSVSGEARFIWR